MTSADPDDLRALETRVLGVRVHGVTRAQAVAWIDARLSAGRRAHVATVNPELVMRARRDASFRALLQRTQLNVPDGAGVVAAARLRGRRMPQRVTGVDLVDDLAALAAARGYRLMLVGAAPGVAAAAARALTARHPALILPAAWVGTPRPAGDAQARQAIARVRPHLVLAAYGAPQQEHWLERNLAHVPGVVGVGVGGTFDFIAGRVRRAPAPLRALGLEWAFRLARQPWRWRRMRALPRFAWLALREAAAERRRG